ncbi:unnamed protein product [Rotaria magnacalcarata]|uniref:Tripeptidyl-peptidase 2 n=3 Tax=Rotaria magnacalcarata TaxID=392030 RepID=A0A814ZZP9_9BILA|nr:unnamed protein product [Rotaria magnacalcarata]CAF1933498.1 unnamed protein product [Rotaria magnacalcarata]CAF3922061.1 unnamed protein product [Rotaria magnacalcarata]
MNCLSTDIDTHFPVAGCLPKQPTGALQLLTKYPQYDGRQITIAVIDTGIDPLASGLQKTTTGQEKIIDLRDSTGSGDVDISTIVKLISNNNSEDRSIQGLSGRKLKIPLNWKNPTGNFHIGIKSLKQLMPSSAFERLIKERREKMFDSEHRLALAEAQRRLDEYINKYSLPTEEQKLTREEFQSFVDALKEVEKKYNDPGPFLDCIVWNDGDKWIACIDTSEQGDLEKCKCLTNYVDSHEFATFSVIDMVTYSVQIHHENNILEIVVAGGSHGTHVGAICAAYFGESCEENGIAPGAQLLSINVGDHRLSTMETIPSLVRAIKYCIDYKVDIINMSYGEDCQIPNAGRVQDLCNEAVEKHGIIFVSSVGNNGPALSTNSAPGATCTNLIGVGGYVTPEMQLAEYALRESTGCTTPFTWSSRGPCTDGWLGVCISAPGAAITSVPKFILCQRQLMNGTSMSSPNAAGCIALLLSALKQENIEYSPPLIRRALMNTAQKLDDEFSVGAGLLQIHKALDYIRSLAKPSLISKIQLDIIGGQGRGIYLRELDQVQVSSGDIGLTIKPKYIPKKTDQTVTYEDQEIKINFACRLSLICDPPASYVQHGKFLDLAFSDRTFDIKIDPSHLQQDQAHFTELQAFDVNQINAGPLARFPITIIKPITVNPQTHSLEFNCQTFKTGQIRRHFLQVPSGSNIAAFKITNHSCDTSAKINLNFIQLEPGRSFHVTEFEKIIRLSPHSTFQCYFNVQDKRTLELCLARWWSSLAIVDTSYSIEFHSIIVSPSVSMHLRSSQSYERFILENRLYNTYEDINGLPIINWKYLVQTLRPNKDESKIQVLSKRDCLTEQRQIYQLILTYNLALLKASDIQIKCPYLHELLYDNEYEGALWMCFDANKQYLGAGDVKKNYSVKLEKGDFIIRMHIRHDQCDLLERLLKDNGGTGLALHIEHKVNGLPAPDFYHSLGALHTQKRKIQASSIKLQWGHQQPIYMTTVQEDKLPKVINSTTGAFLFGTMTFPMNEKMKKLEMNTIYQYFVEPCLSSSSSSSKKSSSSSANSTNKKQTNPIITTTDDGISNSQSQKDQQYQEALRDLKISWIPKLNDDQGKLYEELLCEQQDLNNHIPLHIARLQQLENQLKQQQPILTTEKKDEKLNEIIKFIQDKLLSLFNEDLILNFFGQKNSSSTDKDIQIIKSDMEKRRNWFIDIYVSLGVSLCELSTLNDDTLNYLTNIYKTLQKHIDINDGKLTNFLYKYNLAKKSYGRVWKLLLKQIEEKSASQHQEYDNKLLQLYQTMNMKYLITYQERLLIAKYPQAYVLF